MFDTEIFGLLLAVTVMIALIIILPAGRDD